MTPNHDRPRRRAGLRPISGLGIVEAVLILSAVGFVLAVVLAGGAWR